MSRLARPRAAAQAAWLCGRWRAGSAAAGWAFPSDWHLPSVDAVCEALCAGADVWPTAERLGHDRATAGVSLSETLADIDVVAGMAPEWGSVLCRAVSLGWADRAAAATDAVVDALTGLASADYLRIRLGEVYRTAEVEGYSAATTHALVVIRLWRAGSAAPALNLPMVLAGDVMRTVFAGGQSLARIGPLVAVVLTERSDVLGRQARLLAEMLATRFRVGSGPELLPQVWIEGLPPGYRAATELVDELGR